LAEALLRLSELAMPASVIEFLLLSNEMVFGSEGRQAETTKCFSATPANITTRNEVKEMNFGVYEETASVLLAIRI
jgi:hypothetical protein